MTRTVIDVSSPVLATARLAVVAVGAVLCLLAVATPASAHGRGSDATNYRSDVTAEPDVPGAEWDVHGGDELLELDSPEAEVTVLGYSGEPYLRIGPDGVLRNERSPATYLNEERYRIELPPDADADPEAEPVWEQVTDETAYAWHDHRVHAMTTELPQRVAEAPEEEHLVQEWAVPVVVDGQELAVEGALRWEPGPSRWPWLAVGALIGLLALVGVRRPDLPGLVRPAAVLLGVVSAANLARVVDDVLVMPLPAATIAMSVLQTTLFSAIGLAGAWKAWRGGDGAATALGVGGAAVLIGQGIPFLPVLASSQMSSLMPDAVSRLIAAASIGQALGVGAVAVIGNRRMRPDEGEGGEAEKAPVASETAATGG